MIETFQALPLLHALEGIRCPVLTAIMKVITLCGHEIVPVAVICLIYWCIDKKLAYRIGMAFFASGVTVQTLKMGIRIDRPWVLDPTLDSMHGTFIGDSGYSFPSGHTQAATSLYMTLALYFKDKRAKALLTLLTLAVMFSRLYFGVHTLFDVAVSFLVTMLIVTVLFPLCKDLLDRADGIFATSAVMFAVCLAMLIYSAVLYFNGTVCYELISDSFKTAGAGMGFAVGYFIERRYVNFSVKSKNAAVHALKLILGVASGLGFKALLKALCGANIYSDAARYIFLVVWIIALYPMVIKACFARSDE